MARRIGANRHARPRRHGGFTLLEILVALGVLGIATWILIALFTSSLSYAQTSRYQKVAAGVAEEQLHRIVQTPAAFAWKVADLQEGKPIKLSLRASDEGGPGPYKAHVPDKEAYPANRQAGSREVNFYNGLQWQSYVELPKKDSLYLWVSVVVNWEHARQGQSITLTSAVPRAQVEGLS